MTYHEQWTDIEDRLKNIQQIQPLSGYIRDGIVNLNNWQHQKIRPLFIGKEAYGGAFSITEHLMNRKPAQFCKDSPHSWRKTSVVSYALQNEFLKYAEVYSIRNSDRVAESLRNIAFINVGKHSAKTTTPPERLHELYKQNSAFLHEQIALCQPNIIVGWNTLPLFEKDPAFRKQFAVDGITYQQNGSVRFWVSNGKLFIATYHPASRVKGVTKQKYVDDIVQTVRENLDKIDISLPTM